MVDLFASGSRSSAGVAHLTQLWSSCYASCTGLGSGKSSEWRKASCTLRKTLGLAPLESVLAFLRSLGREGLSASSRLDGSLVVAQQFGVFFGSLRFEVCASPLASPRSRLPPHVCTDLLFIARLLEPHLARLTADLPDPASAAGARAAGAGGR